MTIFMEFMLREMQDQGKLLHNSRWLTSGWFTFRVSCSRYLCNAHETRNNTRPTPKATETATEMALAHKLGSKSHARRFRWGERPAPRLTPLWAFHGFSQAFGQSTGLNIKAWIPWNLSFRYISFHEIRLQMILWHHNANINSHQRLKQMGSAFAFIFGMN